MSKESENLEIQKFSYYTVHALCWTQGGMNGGQQLYGAFFVCLWGFCV